MKLGRPLTRLVRIRTFEIVDSFSIGHLFCMRVRIESLIEHGGFGRVYVAEATDSEVLPAGYKLAAKKVHITKHVKTPMLQHEAAALLMLRDMHIQYFIAPGHESVPDVHCWDRSQYYEYMLLGSSVKIFSKSESAPTLRNLVAIACQMLDAVAHVHRHQLIHGDIKPSNILFGPGGPDSPVGRVYLIDYRLWPREVVRRPHDVETHPRGPDPRSARHSDVRKLARPLSSQDDLESLAYSVPQLLAGLCRGKTPKAQIWR
ncbi:kinase-like domain-containing protein [Mycena olivaceomarginata]|nr:kinase-like domain-containing protein [Mycena olivaceomarginata]